MFDDDEEEYKSIYESGCWSWDNVEHELKFISDIEEEEFVAPSSKVLHNFKFRDDIDVLEQQKFQKKYQRKTKDDDVICLQDVKDIVFYTAPVSILSPAVINMLHLPTTERFLRALILYCQYYLQISDTMNKRRIESKTKIRFRNSDRIEEKYRENLEDLRLLVAKEYSLILLGGGRCSKYYHMSSSKSLSTKYKDALFFDTILSMAVHIVWIALGRKFITEIELEIYRIFKSDIYNDAAHRLKSNLETKINSREKIVEHGVCVKSGKKVNTHSPLINEVFCDRKIHYQLFGLGNIKYNKLSARMQFLQNILIEPEHKFRELGINLGILGLPRGRFDIMLREIKISSTSTTSSMLQRSSTRLSRISRTTSPRKSQLKQSTVWEIPLNINLPDQESFQEPSPDHFPNETLQLPPCNQTQRRKWLKRAVKTRRGMKMQLYKKT